MVGPAYSPILYFDQIYQDSWAYGVNDHDVAVGCYGGCYSGGPGAVVIGQSSNSGGRAIARAIALHGFEGRTCFTIALSINDSGKIVGIACDEAALFSASGYAKALGLGRDSAAEAVNQHGDVVGAAGSSAFERDGRSMQLPKPAGYGSYSAIGYAVNLTDEVVGTLYGNENTSAVAFVYKGGRAYTLDSLLPPHSGWQITDALGVNDHGEIVGDGYYNGNFCGFSLKPPQ